MKTFQAEVISEKMTKSATVSTERSFRHPLYGKILFRKKKIHVANEIGAKLGDLVKIIEIRPISKTISHRISEIIRKTPAKIIVEKNITEKKVKKPEDKK